MTIATYKPGSYLKAFGQTVPGEIGKFAANHGLGDKLHQMLNEAVASGKPIENWDDFGEKLRNQTNDKNRP